MVMLAVPGHKLTPNLALPGHQTPTSFLLGREGQLEQIYSGSQPTFGLET